MPSTTLEFDAILFDMDGTLVDSTAGVVGAWSLFAESYPGINVHEILSSSHGVRTVDNLRIHCGVEDPEELQREAVRFEEAIVSTSSLNGRRGIVALPGAHEIIDDLLSVAKFPKPRWAICTSATRSYASAALNLAGFPLPDVLVAAEDVTKGKPEPDPYLLGAKRCGVPPERCLVIEDAPSGVRSGNAAGCKTLALLTTHSRKQVEDSQPDFIIKDLSSVNMRRTENGIEVEINIASD
ncbi:predicted protein [Sparassis crispa]|uniref:Phosphatase n=1 Tax=Sparassis crispa TaxID=139825 RepID=A0A401GCW2_9APHY|nr:predicted protein [Sparassis crispa]GBE80026.1 predicted protein [Sparassis crispa]